MLSNSTPHDPRCFLASVFQRLQQNRAASSCSAGRHFPLGSPNSISREPFPSWQSRCTSHPQNGTTSTCLTHPQLNSLASTDLAVYLSLLPLAACHVLAMQHSLGLRVSLVSLHFVTQWLVVSFSAPFWASTLAPFLASFAVCVGKSSLVGFARLLVAAFA